MLNYPSFAPDVVARYIHPDGLFVLSERRSDVFGGRVFESLLPYLDGNHSVGEILLGLIELHQDIEVLYALELLRREGVVVDVPEPLNGGPVARGPHEGIEGNGSSAFAVVIENHSSYDQRLLDALLRTPSLTRHADGPMLLVLVDDYLDPVLRTVNERAIAGKTPWMLAKPTGSIFWIGPTFIPDVSACWECLAERVRLNRPIVRFVERQLGERVRLPSCMSDLNATLAASLIVSELATEAQVQNETSDVSMLTFDTVLRSLQRHTVIRRPQCHVCGSASPMPSSITIKGVGPTTVSCDGGLRGETATRTYEELKRHVSPVSGIVPQLMRIESGYDQIHVYVAGQNYAVTARTLAALNRTLRNRSSGKGLTDIQAKTSALCESIERYAAVYQGWEPHIVSTLRDLGDAAIHPNHCMLFSESQYAKRDERNETSDLFTWIPKPFIANEPVWWSTVESLHGQRQKLIPTAYLHFPSDRLVDPSGEEQCVSESNGNAAGRSYSEAILQGLLELIERDAVALWWYPRTRHPGVDLASFGCDFLNACVAYHNSLSRDLWALDLTHDLGIPVFAGVSRMRTGPEKIVLGFGAHIDARTALRRAIAETNQLLAGVNARPSGVETWADPTSTWLNNATVEKEIYLAPKDELSVRARDYSPASSGINGCLEYCLSRIEEAGLEAYVYDLTRPDVALNVVKVICPGLRHFWARFAPGRLYEVPYAMGRAPRFGECDLNPIPMFL